VDADNPWHVGRYRKVPQLAGKSKIITEAGRDTVEDIGYPGWKLDAACTPNGYLAELRTQGAVYDADPDVLGWVVFTAGALGQWEYFGINEIAPIIAAEGTQVPAPVPGAPTRKLLHPLIWSRKSQGFGENPAYYAPFGLRGHNGLDLAVPGTCDVFTWHGTPVIAAHDGKAIIVRDDPSLGVYVYVWGTWCDTLYAHLAEATLPSSGYVKQGDLIGWVGYTGNCRPSGIHGSHLHWAYRPKPYQMQNGYRGYEDPETAL
jgi:murein DD-endopeptidase MepM/ murein hydrolase activator NlpD